MSLINIQRKIVTEIIIKIDLIFSWVIFLYWPSWSWKSYIINHLKEYYKEWIYIDFESYNKIDHDNIWLWTQIKNKFWAKDDLIIQNKIDISNSTVSNISQKTEFTFDEKYIKEKIKSLFNNYNQKFIYLDAIENIIQWDYHFMIEIIEILIKNNVKVIITSRNLEKSFEENSFNITHFSQEEFDEYFEKNFKWFEQYKESIENLCKIIDDKYDNIKLSLLLTLYIEDKNDLFDLISEIKNKTKTLFELWTDHIWEDKFWRDINKIIIEKILGKNKILNNFFKKVFLLRWLNENLLNSIWIEYNNEELEIYQNFIKINWYKQKINIDRNIEVAYFMHDSIYTLLKDYYFSLLNKEWVDSKDIYSSLFNILKILVISDIENIRKENIIKLFELIKDLIYEKEIFDDLVEILGGIWNILFDLWRKEESISKYEESYKIMNSLLEKDSDNIIFKKWISVILSNLWKALSDLWRKEEALDKYNESYIIKKELLEKEAENNDIKKDISLFILNIWDTLSDLWRKEEALGKYEESYKIIKSPLENDPNNNFLNSIIVLVLTKTLNTLYEIWKKEGLIDIYKNLYIARKIILKNDLNNTKNKNNIAMTLENLWDELSDLWKVEEALENYEESYRIKKELLQEDSISCNFKKDIVRILRKIWNSLMILWNYEKADKKYEEAYDILEILLKKDNTRETQFEVSLNLFWAGFILMKLWEYIKSISKSEKCYIYINNLFKAEWDDSLKGFLEKVLNNIIICIDKLSDEEKKWEINRLINTYPEEQFFKQLL